MSDASQAGDYRLLHTMIRVKDLDKALAFYEGQLGMKVLSKTDYPEGKFTNVFVGYGSETANAVIELTHNWDQEEPYDVGSGFGHLAIGVPDIIRRLRAPREGRRDDHPPARADEARHHGHRVRPGPRRLQDRVDRSLRDRWTTTGRDQSSSIAMASTSTRASGWASAVTQKALLAATWPSLKVFLRTSAIWEKSSGFT